jgi:transcriptional regulator with XRE-family HTH domain
LKKYKSKNMIFQPKQKLRDARKKSKMTQVIFSELVAMDQSQYNRREKGRLPISEEEWERFAKILKVDVTVILRR